MVKRGEAEEVVVEIDTYLLIYLVLILQREIYTTTSFGTPVQ